MHEVEAVSSARKMVGKILAGALGAVALCGAWAAGPGEAMAQDGAGPGNPSSYHDNKWDIIMVGCRSVPVASCRIRVTAKGRGGPWDYAAQNGLLDTDGGFIPATSMAIGGREVSLPSHDATTIEGGTSAMIDLNFDRPIYRRDVQALMVYVGHWTAHRIKLDPEFK